MPKRDHLTNRELHILECWILGFTQADVAAQYNITKTRVRQIQKNATKKILRAFYRGEMYKRESMVDQSDIRFVAGYRGHRFEELLAIPDLMLKRIRFKVLGDYIIGKNQVKAALRVRN